MNKQAEQEQYAPIILYNATSLPGQSGSVKGRNRYIASVAYKALNNKLTNNNYRLFCVMENTEI